MALNRRSTELLLALVLALPVSNCGFSQQVADPDFKPKLEKPAFAGGRGPIVLLDEAHYNFHTASGRYAAFADLLRRDGYVVNASKAAFSKPVLQAGNILVIANALSRRNQVDWNPPIDPSFTDDEVKAVREWVNEGGALLLIADHFPMPEAARKLGESFGVHFHNGYAVDPQVPPGPLVFRRADKSLVDHSITRGRAANEIIDQVATFTGSAFQVDSGEPLLTFLGDQAFSYTPKAFGQPPDKDSPRVPIKGWLQGAVLRVGKGRVAVFGEAAMFSAQLAGLTRAPMGMNAPIAPQNAQFLLNLMHWLSGLLDKH